MVRIPPEMPVIAPKLIIEPELMISTLDGIVTVIPAGIVTVSPALIVVGGLAPPHVAGSFQFPF